MNRQPYQAPPRSWPPRLNRTGIRLWKPLRRRRRIKQQRVREVDIRGTEGLAECLGQEHGVLITPNHPGHSDAFVMYEAADWLKRPFYFMTAWQVFGMCGPIQRIILQQHGCFSVDREGSDLRAVRQAIDILQNKPNPLVIFPEGEVYHVNERVMPFQAGTATIALSAAKKADRPVVCVPCAIQYQYLTDPTHELHGLMDRLESEIFWRPRRDLPLPDRIYRFAEAALALKELEYLGKTSSGPLPERLKTLCHFILSQIEERYHIDLSDHSIPERVKSLRQRTVKRRQEAEAGSDEEQQCRLDLDDLFLVVQLYSYPGDYVTESPTVERMAETLDKFEEDVLGVPTAGIRAERKATVTFGEPLSVDPQRRGKDAAAALISELERRVQSLLQRQGEGVTG